MRKFLQMFILVLIFFVSACSDDSSKDDEDVKEEIDYREEMRNFVISISQYSKELSPGFAVIPQNGIELVTVDGESDGPLSNGYLDAIDAHGQEDLFYGYDEDDVKSPDEDVEFISSFLDRSKDAGNTILVTDYCSTQSKVDDSYSLNSSSGYISFAAHERDLNAIPSYPDPVNNENSNDISKMSDVQNFLYIINGEEYTSKEDFITDVSSTNYDLVIMDLFDNNQDPYTSSQIDELNTKANGAKRMVVCYMSIGEAEDYRYYWKDEWSKNSPDWMDEENPDWEGNFKVKYWNKEWQKIIYGNDDSYLKMIIDAGFDGVYLDIIDAFEFFEN
ncbi:MAG: endo alpha-1,4 polygalactosaminidase [Spirochaetes bacterium]|nr:endo alpha-1,4 polygalactosaminidase [Spirochaetota bacterium]MBN2772562.1 endo alpha-1,4 polygalactosaminidase [Spirochaetota bacterium]